MPTFECPVCAKSVTVSRLEDAPFRPFCSHRCKLVDIGRWLDGTYRISEPIPLDKLVECTPDEETPKKD